MQPIDNRFSSQLQLSINILGTVDLQLVHVVGDDNTRRGPLSRGKRVPRLARCGDVGKLLPGDSRYLSIIADSFNLSSAIEDGNVRLTCTVIAPTSPNFLDPNQSSASYPWHKDQTTPVAATAWARAMCPSVAGCSSYAGQ